MKRLIIGSVCALLGISVVAGVAPAAHAATVWNFPSGTITLPEYVTGDPGTLTFTDLTLTDGVLSAGSMLFTANKTWCRPSRFSGNEAVFEVNGAFDCVGNLAFTADSQGRLTVSSSAFGNLHFLLNNTVTSTVFGTQPEAKVTSCSIDSIDAGGVHVSWTASNDSSAGYQLLLNGGSSNQELYNDIVKGGTTTRFAIPVSNLSSADTDSLELSVLTEEAANNGDTSGMKTCTGSIPATPGKPTIGSNPPTTPDGTITVNYAVAEPWTVIGVEYQIDGGAWLRPGGQAPVAGVGGSFGVSKLSTGTHDIRLRSLGKSSAALTTESDAVSFTIPKRTGGSSTVIGSTPAKPVAVPPAQPVSTVSGTSNGAGTGTNGALAATTGDAGIDAPCLAKDGTLYPNQYSTVGSQLTMASNTHGMGTARAFTVTAGALPPGVQLDRTYGVLYGVTSAAGSWVTTVQATFADGTTKSSQFTTRVDADPQTLQYAAQNIGVVGSRIAIAASTNAPVTGTSYKIVCGELPAGTTFNSRTGAITGTPTTVDLMPTPLRVAETSASGKAAASFLFVVQKSGFAAISYPAHPHLRVGHTARIRPTVTGVGEIAVFRMWKGKLPKGLHLNATTGLIWGKPAHAGPTHTITLHAVTKGGALLTSNSMRISTRR